LVQARRVFSYSEAGSSRKGITVAASVGALKMV
jgi:hypothetical protein